MTWPIRNDHIRRVPTGGRAFAADRKTSDKYHAGVDLYATRGDLVESPARGHVVNIYPWPSRREPSGRALLIQSVDGPVFLMAPLEPSTIRVAIGDSVQDGELVGSVGAYPRGSSMLHFEMYSSGTRANKRWYKGMPKPPELADPTFWLLANKTPYLVPVPAVPQPSAPPEAATSSAGWGGLLFVLMLWGASEVFRG